VILGITGTRKGCNAYQYNMMQHFIRSCGQIGEFHHGQCIGVDAEAHNYVRSTHLYTTIIIHPPSDISKVFTLPPDPQVIIKPPQPYLERNKNIVNAVERLLAVPDGPERVHSGTWNTVRHARSVKTPVIIILPEGVCHHE